MNKWNNDVIVSICVALIIVVAIICATIIFSRSEDTEALKYCFQAASDVSDCLRADAYAIPYIEE